MLRQIRGRWLVVAAMIASLPSAASADASTSWAPDELVVRPAPVARAQAHAMLGLEGAATRVEIPQLDLVVLRVPHGRMETLERDLRASRLFRFVERNYVAQVASDPDDPLYPQQWGLFSTNVPQVWGSTQGQGVVVGVVDTGVDVDHPDLIDRLLPGYNTILESPGAEDDNGHGTRMSGIVGATAFNGLGAVGVAPLVDILPVKAMDETGSGFHADIAQAITYAVDNGAGVVNLSLGGGTPSSTLASAVEYAVQQGAVVVASMGNSGSQFPHYPAAYADAIAVGAVDIADVRASFSNFGSWIDLVAPGVGIATTNIGGSYATSTGTSPASAFVAGAAALVRSVHPSLQPSQISTLLTVTAVDRGSPGFDVEYGWGRLDVERAIAAALELASTPDSAAPTVTVLSPQPYEFLEGEVQLSADVSDDVGVVRVEYELDGVVIASTSTAPFAAVWNTSAVMSGAHVLEATAFDASGNRGFSAPVPIEVSGVDLSCGAPGITCLGGGARLDTDCLAEWIVFDGAVVNASGHKRPKVTCRDGDSCDQDGQADGVCTFHVAACFGVPDSRLPECNPDREITKFKLAAPGIGRRRKDPFDDANATAIVAAVSALSTGQSQGKCIAGTLNRGCGNHGDCDSVVGTSDGVCGIREVALSGVMGAGERCTALQSVRVPLRQGKAGLRPGKRIFKAVSIGLKVGRKRPKDADAFLLLCRPAGL